MNRIRQIHALHQKFQNYLESLDEPQLEKLLNGDLDLSFEAKPKQKSSNNKSLNEQRLQNVISNIEASSSREEVQLLLDSLKRLELEFISRKLDIPLQKSDTVERVKDKIVESTVGYRSRSEAIQNRTGNTK